MITKHILDRDLDYDVERIINRLRSFRNKATPAIFGDELGFLLFIGALLFFGLYWRIGILVTDNWTIGNTMVAVADGHLHIKELVYGPPDTRTPGMHFVDGKVYGRNYGQVFIALPFLWVIEAVAFLVELRIAIAGAWSLLLLGFVERVGTILGDRERFVLLGAVGALVTFAVNTAFALPLPSDQIHLVALQLSTMVAAAFIGVVLYRLVSAIHDRRTGVFVGAATVLATPIGFWASLPKRHVLIALLAMVTIAAFYASRAIESDRVALWYRGAAYGAVGIAAWIHAAEALTLFFVLAPMDLATTRSNAPRRLAFVGTVFLVSLLPFFLTNQLIAGNPLVSPRFIELAPGASTTPAPEPTPAPGGETPADGGGDGFSVAPLVDFVIASVERLQSFFTTMMTFGIAAIEQWTGFVSRGADETALDPARIYHTYVRSSPATTRATATDLTMLETTPLFGVFVVVPIVLWSRIKSSELLGHLLASPVRQTDAMAIAYVLALALFNLDRLPLYAMWTVRQVLPMVPVGMYFVGRLVPIRKVLAHQAQLLAYSYAGLVFIGGQFLVVYLISLAPTRGEIMQFHGILGLVAAAVVGVWIVGAALDVYDDIRVGAVAIAVPLAVGTLFVLLTGLEYFVVGPFGLALSELVSGAIPLF